MEMELDGHISFLDLYTDIYTTPDEAFQKRTPTQSSTLIIVLSQREF